MPLHRITDPSLNQIKATLASMLAEGIADSEVRQLALEISVSSDDPKTAIWDWMRENIHYVPDPASLGELFIKPRKMVDDYRAERILAGDCDDYALFAGALLGSIGYRVKLILIGCDNYEIDHAYIEVETEIGWIGFDPSSNIFLGWSIEYVRRIDIEPSF